ncbi:MAG TPA: DUF4175 family protein, partial [Tepidisphaeraceae bacterium]|nr:DUF4175 family protein [Tepidisphaeraceae bacterium]
MTQLAHHPALLQIEDRLDAAGQKYRGQRIVRGAILWLATAIAASWSAALAAHFIGAVSVGGSVWTYLVLAIWLAVIIAATVVWIVRPLFIRPAAVEVARLLESRVPGLHNGLTNGVLLARAEDLHDSPWLPQIFEEIHQTIAREPIGDAVRLADLRPVFVRAMLIALPLLLVSGIFPRPFVHGWQQMLHPAAFVPQVAATTHIIDVQPGDVTLVRDQPLEIMATATGSAAQDAKLIFDNGSPSASMPGMASDSGTRYSYRVEHVDQSFKYRLEIGGTQSRWYSVNVVRQILLQQVTLKITPPAYTRKVSSVLALKTVEIAATPITVPQGSAIELTEGIDIAANAAMFQIGEQPPTPMTANTTHTAFSTSLTIVDDVTAAMLLTDGAGQVVAKLPADSLAIHCSKDAAPAIEMRWPAHDAVVAPADELKVQATIHDDYGVTSARVLLSANATDPLAPVATFNYPASSDAVDLASVLDLKPEVRKHGNAIRVQVQATDNRDLGAGNGPQTTASPIIEIKFRDPETIAKEERESSDKLRTILWQMLKTQQALHAQTIAWKPAAADVMRKISSGQSSLRETMRSTAETFTFDASNQIIQKTLLVLSLNPAKDAVDQSAALLKAIDPKE